MAKTMEEIADELQKVKFRKTLFGGVDEQDVWDTLERMQKEYRELVQEEKIRCQALLDEREAFIAKQNGRLKALRQQLAENGVL